MKRIKLVRKIVSVLLCFSILCTFMPVGLADGGDPPPSANADLSSLTVAGLASYDLDPVFNPETVEYTVNVSNDVTGVEVTAVTDSVYATLEIGGAAAASGVLQTINDLEVGDNEVVVKVTAEDGITVKPYTLTINRADAVAANPLPETPAAYAASDYAKYAARMAAGEAHIAVINANGAVEAGGDNSKFQREVPEELSGVKVKAVAAGTYHSLALTEDGRVFAWGQTRQDSSGTMAAVTIPAEVQPVQGDIKLIAAGASMSAVVTNSDQVIVWGYNSEDLDTTIPSGLSNITAIALSNNCAVVLTADGNINVWGSEECTSMPEGLNGNAVAVAVGMSHWLALKNDGTVTISGGSGQLRFCGNIVDQTDVRAIIGGWQFAGAILADGSVKVWGRAPADNYNDGEVLIAPSADVKALTCTISISNTSLRSSVIGAMQADGALVILAPASDLFTRDPISEDFNFLGGSPSVSSNADLSSLTVEDYVLNDVFDAAVTEYTVNVPHEITSVNITATTADSDAILKINGAAATSGAPQTVDGLVVGANPVEVEVTAQDSTTTKTYTLTVKRALQSDALDDGSLASLSVASVVGEGANAQVETCAIYPEFSSSQTEGIVDIANDAAEVRITALPTSTKSILAINGQTVTPGTAFVVDAQDLNVGDNPIPVLVTAANGNQFVYTLHVKRVSASYQMPAMHQTPETYQDSDYVKYTRRLATGTGYQHALAVKNDGTLIAWGQGDRGKNNIPAGLADVTAVASGRMHVLALKKDGTIATWGFNYAGQLDIPAGLQNIAAISAGALFSAALDKSGQVYAWGDNSNGQCDVPDGLGNVVDIQCGGDHVLALKADGTVAAWGNNYSGQCDVPAGLDHVVAIAADYGTHSVALKDDGTMVIWGGKGYGVWVNIKNTELKYFKGISANGRYITGLKWDGSMAVLVEREDIRENIGVPLQPEQEILAVCSSSGSGILALKADGTLTAWGGTDTFNDYDIPDGLNLFEDDPAPYSGPSPGIPQTPTEYAVSNYARAAAKIAPVSGGVAVLNMDGTVKVVSVDQTDIDYTIPEGLADVTAIASSTHTLMALKADGTVVVWGYDGDYQSQVPKDLGKVIAIATGCHSSPYCLALEEDGTITAWGGNIYGQCDVPAGLDHVTAIAAGEKHCLALKDDGTVVAWGDNIYGQCDVPSGLNNVARIYVGRDFSLALKNDGTVVAWGSNKDYSGNEYTCGQCDVPEGLSGVVDIAIRDQTCIALKNNGTVVVWGDNNYGRRNVPNGLHGVAAVSGRNGIAAIKTDGTVVNWGYIYWYENLLAGLSKVLTISNSTNTAVFRDGSLRYFNTHSPTALGVNEGLTGLNVLSGHYFAIDNVELLDSEGQVIISVPSQGGYRIQAQVANNYASSTNGLTIIQVRAGAGATSTGGGRVLGCVGINSLIPVTGSTISSDFTMPTGISGTAYVDVFVWDGWDTLVPRAEARQDMSFTVTN